MLAQQDPSKTRLSSHWADRVHLLWLHRVFLVRVIGVALILSLTLSVLIPKQYKSMASIMPPDQQGGGAMMLAALVGKGGLGSLGGLASGLLGVHSNTALFVSLLQSDAIRGKLLDRFHLQQVYHSRYRFAAAKHLGRQTKITEDKKSGVISIEVEDTDPVRARDMAQAYLDELNALLNKTSASTARQERIFIELRLRNVQDDLEQAQLALSAFSSKNSTIDIKEQTRAMVDAGARVQGEMLVAQSSLQAQRQIYGDGNIRVKEAQARIATLQHQLDHMAGSSAPLPVQEFSNDQPGREDSAMYPPLRQLPRLAVPYADLYRRVKVEETVFELLTQQYEMARIEEAKDVPVISVIDTPGIAEKKSYPPRVLLALGLTLLSFLAGCGIVILREAWSLLDAADPRKILAAEVLPVLRRSTRAISQRREPAI
jgi:capsule polysaccharide export protein KpsE/RkpR